MKDMKIEAICVGQVQTNCYIAFHAKTKEAVIVDPGDQAGIIIKRIENKDLKPVAILLTHGHFDHMLAALPLKEYYKIPIYAHEKEKAVLMDDEANLTGSWMNRPLTFEADYYLKDGETVSLCRFDFKTIHTPGHTIGGVCYYVESEQVLFCGDTLFCRSFGRVDLLTASPEMLIDSLIHKVLVLPDEVRAYPGHGEDTLIGDEKKKNPILRYK